MEQPVSSRIDFCETETQATFRSHDRLLFQIDANSRNQVHDDLLRRLTLIARAPIVAFCAATPVGESLRIRLTPTRRLPPASTD